LKRPRILARGRCDVCMSKKVGPLGIWHGSCGPQGGSVLWEKRCLWKAQRREVNTTCILRSRSSWPAWGSGQFWLLSSIRNREKRQRKSIVGACLSCDHDGKERSAQPDGLQVLLAACLHPRFDHRHRAVRLRKHVCMLPIANACGPRGDRTSGHP
jgi:hypothetical protein